LQGFITKKVAKENKNKFFFKTNKNQVTLLHHQKRIYNLTEKKRAKGGPAKPS
jgi:hypothetical protein